MNPEELYEVDAQAAGELDAANAAGIPLIFALTGFGEAGKVSSQASEVVLGSLPHSKLASFDVDQLLDYRSRRPAVTFREDRLEDYDTPELAVYLVHDEMARPFLFMTGMEPDLQWERFAQAFITLVRRFKVGLVTWVHSIPMPVPHTRPLGVTVHGNFARYLSRSSTWKPIVTIPSSAGHLLEIRLCEADISVAGFAIHVPHYLADAEYPAAAASAVDHLSAATSLMIPTDLLRDSARDIDRQIEEQVSQSEEIRKVVETLENRYDAFMDGSAGGSLLTGPGNRLPNADEIAQELEDFLSRHRGDEPETE